VEFFCKQKIRRPIYNDRSLRDTWLTFEVCGMAQSKNKNEARLQELIATARTMNLEVRTEKLLREAGYRAHSGRCRVKDQELIVIDRDASIAEQIEFLSGELARVTAATDASTETSADQRLD
jgi:hypothetical protein